MPIITISRGLLTGGEQVAQQLGSRLGLKVLSREVIVEAAQEYGVSEQELIKGMMSPPGFWERFVGKRERYLLAIQATLAEMVADGNVVYHGNAGQLLLSELPHVLKIRLVAPMEQRVRAAMAEHDISREEAIQHIESSDQQRSKWVRALYNVEWSDPSLYDIVLNLGHMTVDAATDLIVDVLKHDEFQRTPEIDRKLHDFALCMRVRAALHFKSDYGDDTVEARVHNGVVQLAGGGEFERQRSAIVEFVRGVPGVKEVLTDEDHGSTIGDEHKPAGKTAADIMVPLSGYPHIHQTASIRDSMAALAASTVQLADGHLMAPRYVLIINDDYQLVGVVSRRDLLRGITPQLTSFERAKHSLGQINPAADFALPVSLSWNAMFSKAALTNASQPVHTVMAPIRGTVHTDDDLSAVVSTMIHNAIDVVPVIDKDRAVGVVLMTDVFDTVAQFVMEKGGETKQA